MTTRTFTRHDHSRIIPHVVGRVRAAEFTTLEEIAGAFGVHKSTASRWMKKARNAGLIEPRACRLSLLQARLFRELQAA